MFLLKMLLPYGSSHPSLGGDEAIFCSLSREAKSFLRITRHHPHLLQGKHEPDLSWKGVLVANQLLEKFLLAPRAQLEGVPS